MVINLLEYSTQLTIKPMQSKPTFANHHKLNVNTEFFFRSYCLLLGLLWVRFSSPLSIFSQRSPTMQRFVQLQPSKIIRIYCPFECTTFMLENPYTSNCTKFVTVFFSLRICSWYVFCVCRGLLNYQ